MELFFDTIQQTLFFTLKQLPYIVIGLFLAEMMVAMKWIEKLAWVTKSIMRYAHLDAGCGIKMGISMENTWKMTFMIMET